MAWVEMWLLSCHTAFCGPDLTLLLSAWGLPRWRCGESGELMQEAEAKMLYLIWENVKICILSIHFIPSAGPRMVTEFASIDGRDLFGFQHLCLVVMVL